MKETPRLAWHNLRRRVNLTYCTARSGPDRLADLTKIPMTFRRTLGIKGALPAFDRPALRLPDANHEVCHVPILWIARACLGSTLVAEDRGGGGCGPLGRYDAAQRAQGARAGRRAEGAEEARDLIVAGRRREPIGDLGPQAGPADRRTV